MLLFGIQASQDVKLSNIGRALEEVIPLIRTEKRLSRNLKHAELEAALTTKLSCVSDGGGLLRRHLPRTTDEAAHPHRQAARHLTAILRHSTLPLLCLADGIRRVLSASAFRPPQESPPDAQLELALIWSA